MENNHLMRFIKNAGFTEFGACVEDIEYHADRNLGKVQITSLATYNNITEQFLSATRCGKTNLACALGMVAVRNFYTLKYILLLDLSAQLVITRNNGTYRKVNQQYKKPSLLILDEWVLYSQKDTDARNLLEIAVVRYKKASKIFCSQFQ